MKSQPALASVPGILAGGCRERYCFAVDDDACAAVDFPVAKANKKLVETPPPAGVRRAGLVMGSIFIAILIVITARVASPQQEQLRTFYETSDDLIRVALGLAVYIGSPSRCSC